MNGNTLNQMIYQLNTTHMKCLQTLEEYAYYITRCLKEKFNINEIVRVTFENPKGMHEAIIYPKSSVIQEQGIKNPMFFFAYVLNIHEDGIHLIFTEDYEEFERMRKKL